MIELILGGHALVKAGWPSIKPPDHKQKLLILPQPPQVMVK